ncbi:MAG TPA: hypothetical protein VGQ29_13255 [Gemmatimonadales bacterium]|jgi:hypothetical protein|nr:hypothetical protein [Gemmatimonadales bacterium]
MKVPGELYTRSPRLYEGLVDLRYPLHDWTGTVTHCGRICYTSRKINLSRVFAGQNVGGEAGRTAPSAALDGPSLRSHTPGSGNPPLRHLT